VEEQDRLKPFANTQVSDEPFSKRGYLKIYEGVSEVM